MIDLVFIKSDGREFHFGPELLGLTSTDSAEGGWESLTALIPQNVQTVGVLEEHDKVRLYHRLKLVWGGRIREIPDTATVRVAQAIICEGEFANLGDNTFRRLFIDQGFSGWDEDAPVPWADTWNVDLFERTNNSGLLIRLKKGDSVVASNGAAYYYRPGNPDQINQDLFSITFGYVLGAGAGSNLSARLYSHSSDLSGSNLEWSVTGDGTTQSGSITVTIAANKKALAFRLWASGSATAANDFAFLKITNIRVNGLSGFEVADTPKADDVIKDRLSVASQFSTDVSLIQPGTFTILDLVYPDDMTVLDLIADVNQVEGYRWGVWDVDADDDAMLTYEAFDDGTVHYLTTLRTAYPDLAGRSLGHQFNQVNVTYKNPAGGPNLVTQRTAANAIIDGWSNTRTGQISVDTQVLAQAQQVGDKWLADQPARPGRGTYIVQGTVRDSQGGSIPVFEMAAGKNIMIQDLRPQPVDLDTMTSDQVLNGRNTYRIISMETNWMTQTAILQLDNEGDDLAIELSRKGL